MDTAELRSAPGIISCDETTIVVGDPCDRRARRRETVGRRCSSARRSRSRSRSRRRPRSSGSGRSGRHPVEADIVVAFLASAVGIALGAGVVARRAWRIVVSPTAGGVFHERERLFGGGFRRRKLADATAVRSVEVHSRADDDHGPVWEVVLRTRWRTVRIWHTPSREAADALRASLERLLARVGYGLNPPEP
jgi:hypothetical protein